eukprot:scaffold25716_cov33-Tisochrysis_lutea.AAC.1
MAEAPLAPAMVALLWQRDPGPGGPHGHNSLTSKSDQTYKAPPWPWQGRARPTAESPGQTPTPTSTQHSSLQSPSPILLTANPPTPVPQEPDSAEEDQQVGSGALLALGWAVRGRLALRRAASRLWRCGASQVGRGGEGRLGLGSSRGTLHRSNCNNIF